MSYQTREKGAIDKCVAELRASECSSWKEFDHFIADLLEWPSQCENTLEVYLDCYDDGSFKGFTVVIGDDDLGFLGADARCRLAEIFYKNPNGANLSCAQYRVELNTLAEPGQICLYVVTT